jgi:hypothetical protein
MRLSNMGDYEKSFFKEIYRELLEESVNSRLSSKEYDTVVDMLDQIGIDKYTLDVMQGFNGEIFFNVQEKDLYSPDGDYAHDKKMLVQGRHWQLHVSGKP